MDFSLEQIMELLEDKTVISWCDIYVRLGIAERLKAQNRYDVQYVLASAKTQELVRDKLKENLAHKYKSHYKKRTIDALAGMDFLCYSPTTKENIVGLKIMLES